MAAAYSSPSVSRFIWVVVSIIDNLIIAALVIGFLTIVSADAVVSSAR